MRSAGRKRLHGRGMGDHPTVSGPHYQSGPPAAAPGTGCVARDPVFSGDGVPVGAVAPRLSAVHDGAVPFLPDARQRPARHDQRGAGG